MTRAIKQRARATPRATTRARRTPLETLAKRQRHLPRLCAADDGGGARAGLRRALRLRLSLRPGARRRPRRHRRVRAPPTPGSEIYLPGAGWVEFDPTNGIVGGREPDPRRASRAIPRRPCRSPAASSGRCRTIWGWRSRCAWSAGAAEASRCARLQAVVAARSCPACSTSPYTCTGGPDAQTLPAAAGLYYYPAATKQKLPKCSTGGLAVEAGRYPAAQNAKPRLWGAFAWRVLDW